MRRSQILSSVVIQALLVAGVALLVGLPLGVAAGRLAWSGFASDLGVVDTLRLPVGVMALAVVVVGAGAALVAAVPALVAAKARPRTRCDRSEVAPGLGSPSRPGPRRVEHARSS